MQFVLFAHGRGGSSNLLKILQLHPSLRVAEEPFHKKYHEWHPDEPNYIDLITDISSLEEQLRALFAKYNGIKVLNYQLPEEVYAHLLLKPDLKVIYLKRRNLLQATVSLFIAEQTGVWKMWDLKSDIDSVYARLEPLPLEEFADNLDYGIELRAYYGQVIARKPEEGRLMVDYEDLYTENMRRNREQVAGIFRFLGLESPASERFDYYLDPRASKLNYSGIHARLPNAREIEERFGSDEVGWLFK